MPNEIVSVTGGDVSGFEKRGRAVLYYPGRSQKISTNRTQQVELTSGESTGYNDRWDDPRYYTDNSTPSYFV